jgi:4-amino-4-deoxy-L-arabinose transferase-like glycosyltransferase
MSGNAGPMPRSARPLSRTLLNNIWLLLPLVFVIGPDLRSIDYGAHWDEKPGHIRPVRTMFESGTLLPDFYEYPSLDYWINAAAVMPDLAAARLHGRGSLQQEALQTINSDAYLFRLRRIYLLISALSLVWVYVLVAQWRRSTVEALLAASFLGLSWEVGYHLRWIATDGVLMQFGALTILLVMTSHLRQRSLLWLRLGAIAAGLGCGVKYPGGLLILPVLAGAYLAWDRNAPRADLVRFCLGLVAIFLITYLISTPGTLLQPGKFLHDVLYQLRHYAFDGHRGHSVGRGFQHGLYIFIYLGTVFLSPYMPAAILSSTLCILGGFALVSESRRTAGLFLCFPAAYLLYFSSQRVMFVRNLLIVGPFLAVLAARGVLFAWTHLTMGRSLTFFAGRVKLNLLRGAFSVIVATCFFMNGIWLVQASRSITNRTPNRAASEALAYIRGSGRTRFLLSPRARAALAPAGTTDLPNVTADAPHAESVVFYSGEATNRGDWPGYTPNLTQRWFGRYAVNINYYPDWLDEDQILVMSTAKAREVRMEGVDYGSGRVVGDYNGAAFVSQSVPTSMTGGTNYPIAVTMRNTGTTTWTEEGLYRLGSQNPQDNPLWGVNRLMLSTSIAPGGEATFKFTITAPSAQSSYDFRWRMVQDGVEWFGDYTPDIPFQGECVSTIQRAR